MICLVTSSISCPMISIFEVIIVMYRTIGGGVVGLNHCWWLYMAQVNKHIANGNWHLCIVEYTTYLCFSRWWCWVWERGECQRDKIRLRKTYLLLIVLFRLAVVRWETDLVYTFNLTFIWPYFNTRCRHQLRSTETFKIFKVLWTCPCDPYQAGR